MSYDLNKLIIAVDFDGTLCENKWPDIGEPNSKLIEYLKRQKAEGNKIILWTCRSGERLEKAVIWCAEQGLMFDALNENLPEIVEKFGGESRKIFAHIYIDDSNDKTFALPFNSSAFVKVTEHYGYVEKDTDLVALYFIETNGKKHFSGYCSDILEAKKECEFLEGSWYRRLV